MSIIELFSGEDVTNRNRAFNMLRMKLYVCPICGNVIQSTGEAVVSCCGILLPPLEAEPEDDAHRLSVERVEDEYYVTVAHEMGKAHYISFILAVRDDGCEIKKLYPREAPKRASRSAGPVGVLLLQPARAVQGSAAIKAYPAFFNASTARSRFSCFTRI